MIESGDLDQGLKEIPVTPSWKGHPSCIMWRQFALRSVENAIEIVIEKTEEKGRTTEMQAAAETNSGGRFHSTARAETMKSQATAL